MCDRKLLQCTIHCLIFVIIIILVAVDGVTLSLGSNYYHIRVTSEELQAQSQFIVLNVSLSRPLLNEEYIAAAHILGEDIKFELNSSTLSVHPVRPVSPGRHNMNIVMVIGGSQSFVLSAPLTIDVIAEGIQINFRTRRKPHGLPVH